MTEKGYILAVYIAPELENELWKEYTETLDELKFINDELAKHKCKRCQKYKKLQADKIATESYLNEIANLWIPF